MLSLQATSDAELTWEQMDRRGKRFELRADTALIATLDLPKIWKSTATARAADGIWEFQRVGFFRPRLLIHTAGLADDIATFAGAGYGKSRVTLHDGRVFAWQPARGRGKRWTFIDEAGQTTVDFSDASQRSSAYQFTVQIAAALRGEPTGALLAALGMYLIVEAVTAAMITTTTAATTGA